MERMADCEFDAPAAKNGVPRQNATATIPMCTNPRPPKIHNKRFAFAPQTRSLAPGGAMLMARLYS